MATELTTTKVSIDGTVKSDALAVEALGLATRILVPASHSLALLRAIKRLPEAEQRSELQKADFWSYVFSLVSHAAEIGHRIRKDVRASELLVDARTHLSESPSRLLSSLLDNKLEGYDRMRMIRDKAVFHFDDELAQIAQESIADGNDTPFSAFEGAEPVKGTVYYPLAIYSMVALAARDGFPVETLLPLADQLRDLAEHLAAALLRSAGLQIVPSN